LDKKIIKPNYVYILECRDGTLYTGWTNDLPKRIENHNLGKASKYTSCRLPVVLKYFETFHNKIDAQKREYQIKQYSRLEKLNLINQ
jgi:putative endonuclease